MRILKGGETRDEDGDRALSTLGDNLGNGTIQILGIYWGLSPKNPQISRMGTELQLLQHLGMVWGWGNPKFWGGDGGRNIGDFPTTIRHNRDFGSFLDIAK